MDLHYDITQSSTDRLTFYLRANQTPSYNGAATAYAQSLCRATTSPRHRARAMDEWLGREAKRMLDGHPIGEWLADDPERARRICINLSAVPSHNIIRLRFISASDAMLFRLVFH